METTCLYKENTLVLPALGTALSNTAFMSAGREEMRTCKVAHCGSLLSCDKSACNKAARARGRARASRKKFI